MVMPGMQQQGYGMQGMQPQMGQQQMGMGMGVGAPQGQMMMQPGGMQGAPEAIRRAAAAAADGGMGTFSPPQFKQTSPGGQGQQQGAGGAPVSCERRTPRATGGSFESPSGDARESISRLPRRWRTRRWRRTTTTLLSRRAAARCEKRFGECAPAA